MPERRSETSGAAGGDGQGALPGAAPPDLRDPSGFWRLPHDDLRAVLARRDLTGEELRVYLALADLTLGYGRAGDIVSISQIAGQAGGMDRPHVVRALHALAKRGLYAQRRASGQSVFRQVVWPAPPIAACGNSARAVAGRGNSPATVARPVAKAVALGGTHQDTKTPEKEAGAARLGGQGGREPVAQAADGAVGRIVALWVRGHRLRVGTGYAASARGCLAGTLARLFKDFGDDVLKAAVGRWFGCDRATYGIGLFGKKLQDGDRDLRGGPAGAKPAGKNAYNSAPTPETYRGIGKRFDMPAGGQAEAEA